MSYLRTFFKEVVKAPDAAKTPANDVAASKAGKTPTQPGPTPTGPTAPALQSLKIEPPTASIATGHQYQLKAFGVTAAGDKIDVTKSVAWRSSDDKIVSVDQNGLATGGPTVKPAKITAKHASGQEHTIDFNVIPRVLKSILLSQKLGSVPRLVGGGSVQFQPFGTFTDGTTYDIKGEVVWSVSDRKVLAIDGKGIASALGVGRSKIIATHPSGVKGDVEISVESPGSGARKINVQVLMYNFDNHPIMGGHGLVAFTNPAGKDVALGGDISGGVLRFSNAILMPEGTMQLSAHGYTDDAPYTIGTTPYKLPAGDLITFQATQQANTATTKADSPEQAAKNVGATGKRHTDYEVEKLDVNQWRVKWGENVWIVKQG